LPVAAWSGSLLFIYSTRDLLNTWNRFKKTENLKLCHPERSATKNLSAAQLSSAKSKDPGTFSISNTASRRSLDNLRFKAFKPNRARRFLLVASSQRLAALA